VTRELISRRIARGSFILTGGQVVSQLLALVFSIIIARLLKPEDYGLITVAMTYPSLLISLSTLGLETAVATHVAEPSSKREEYAWGGFMMRSSVASIAGLLVYTHAGFFANLMSKPEVTPLIETLSLYTVFSSVTGVIVAAFSGLGKYEVSALVNTLHYALRGPLAIALIIAGFGVHGAVASHTLASIVVFSAYLALYLSVFKRPIITRTALRDLLRLAMPIYFAGLASTFTWPVVNTILSINVSRSELGNYSAAVNAQAPLGALIGGISTAVLTSFPLLTNDLDSFKKGVVKTAFYFSAVSSALGYCYAAVLMPLVRLAYGRTYANAHLYALVFAISNVLPVMVASSVVSSAFATLKKTLWNAVLGAVQAISTITLAYYLVPIHGVLGAGMAFTAGNLLPAVLGLIVLSRRFNIHVYPRDLLRASAPAIMAFAASTPISHVLMDFAARYWYMQIHLYVLGLVIAVLAGLAVYAAAYLALLSFFVDKNSVRVLVDLASGLEIVGGIIRPLGNRYLKLLGLFNGP